MLVVAMALFRQLLLLAYAFERLLVGLLVHEAAGLGIALDPAVIVRIVGLRTVAYLADAVSVANGGICCHGVTPSVDLLNAALTTPRYL
jgi:hypothetical protein